MWACWWCWPQAGVDGAVVLAVEVLDAPPEESEVDDDDEPESDVDVDAALADPLLEDDEPPRESVL